MVPWLAALRGPPAGSSLASGQRIIYSCGGASRPRHGYSIALSPCWECRKKAFSVAINNRLRTGTDKGNPTV